MSDLRRRMFLLALFPLVVLIASCKDATGVCEGPLCDTGDRETLRATELCSDFSPRDIATFVDVNLEAGVRTELGITAQDDLTCALVSGLTELEVSDAGIGSLVGIQNLVRLQILKLGFNQIVDISPIAELIGLQRVELFGNNVADISALSGLGGLEALLLTGNRISDIDGLAGLTNLRHVLLNKNQITDLAPLGGLSSLELISLDENLISDLSPLSGLTNAEILILDDNSIADVTALTDLTRLSELRLRLNPGLSDIQPLLDNTGLGAGDLVDLSSTSVSCADITALEAKGVTVTSDCP